MCIRDSNKFNKPHTAPTNDNHAHGYRSRNTRQTNKTLNENSQGRTNNGNIPNGMNNPYLQYGSGIALQPFVPPTQYPPNQYPPFPQPTSNQFPVYPQVPQMPQIYPPTMGHFPPQYVPQGQYPPPSNSGFSNNPVQAFGPPQYNQQYPIASQPQPQPNNLSLAQPNQQFGMTPAHQLHQLLLKQQQQQQNQNPDYQQPRP